MTSDTLAPVVRAPQELVGETGPGMFGIVRAPLLVLREAQEAAAALKGVIDAKPNPVKFSGETYLEFEDWQTVGRFYGIAPRIDSTRYVEFGPVAGFEASASAVHVETGRVVSTADSMCLNDEDKWRARPKYEWHYVKKSGGTSADDPGPGELIWEKGADGKNRPRKSRVLIGEEAVPLFQLRSMAQTRAGAKALRNALAWVVVLAGYKPTPAEEMDGAVPDRPARPASSPALAGASAPEAPATDPPEDVAELVAKIKARWAQLNVSETLQRRQWAAHCGQVPFGEAAPTLDVGMLNILLGLLGAAPR